MNPDIFDYKKPTEENIARIEETRKAYGALYAHLLTLPKNREISLAITNLEQSAMWATKSLAFNE